MKISLKWLCDFVDIQDYFKKPEQLAEVLTKAGLEVEEIKNLAKDFEHVVVGLILEKDKHPNADKLSLCRITTGEGVVHQIVCGAQNHKANDRVIVALPGAVLPGNFIIKQAAVRGVDSGGMLCSYKELGLATVSDGIAILPETATIGQSFAEFGGYDDVTFELKVTANRADCLSHYGLAREVACLLGRELKKNPVFETDSKISTQEQFAVQVQESVLCPRYTGRLLKGVNVGPSPLWLQKRLEAVGMNSINNIVDVTNYVMLELGQPLHAFDASQIRGSKIIVAKSQAQEKFTTLDGTELLLAGDELMIKDSERSLCMAGVIGGKNSGVSDATVDVFLEAAYFAPASVRKSLRHHGLNTDSGYRFSRGVDPEGTLLALHRASELILQVAGGTALANAIDHYPVRQEKAPVSLKIQTINERLGFAAKPVLFEDYMKRLGCQLQTVAEGDYVVTPPSYRFDLEIDMDLVEEYARLIGYEHIPENIPTLAAAPAAHDLNYLLHRVVSENLRAQGYSQAMHLALTGTRSQLHFLKNLNSLREAGLAISEMPIKILNPLNEEQDSLRMSLSFGMWQNIVRNFHQGNQFGRLFEIGKTFQFNGLGQYGENWRLALSAWGHPAGLWQKDFNYPLVFELKAKVESLLQRFGIGNYQWLSVSKRGDVCDFIHRGQFAHLMVEGKKIGFIGSMHPALLEDEKVRVPAAICELDLDLLLKGQPRSRKIESFSRFPKIDRDLSLVMAKSVNVAQVETEIRAAAGEHFVDLEIIDVYSGDKLDLGQKSVTFHLVFQDRKDTLRDQVVQEAVDRVLHNLSEKLQISVR